MMPNICIVSSCRRGFHTSTPRRQIYDSVLDTIGRTPVVKANKVLPQKAKNNGVNLYAKLEYFNPLGSVKDRVAIAFIDAAERSGALRPGQTVIEATAGNTGIGLAMVCANRGYPFVAVMGEYFSVDRRKIMRALGAKVILTPSADSGIGMVLKAKELAEARKWYWPRQLDNIENIHYHANTTGPEILRDFAGHRLDYWVTGYGIGGTFTGVGSVLKLARPDTKIVLAEPENSALVRSGISQSLLPDGLPASSHPAFKSHKIQGWTPNFIPKILEQGIKSKFHDLIVTVQDEESIEMAKRLAKSEGIFTGISGGATTIAGCKVAENAPKGSTILVMLPDSQERYQSTVLFDDIKAEMNEEELSISKSTPSCQLID